MPKKKLWILGDSYASPFVPRCEFDPWVSRMAKRYDVINLARDGTGPDLSIRHLVDLIAENPDTASDTSVIFLISSIFRFNFKFLNHADQVLAPYVSDIYEGTRNDSAVERLRVYAKYRGFVTDFMGEYIWNSSYTLTELLKILGLLHMMSHRVEKILAWPIFDQQSLATVQDDGSFFYVRTNLYDIEQARFGLGEDRRPNHLSERNHEVMFTQLSNWMDNNSPIDVSLFHPTG